MAPAARTPARASPQVWGTGLASSRRTWRTTTSSRRVATRAAFPPVSSPPATTRWTPPTRNLKVGVNFFFNKNLNHLNVELAANHGQSTYGPSNITAATAGYVPTSLDPVTATGSRRPFTNSLANPAFKSLLMHWNVLF